MPLIKKFLHTRFRVRDIDRSIEFYAKTFGFKVAERKTSPRGSKLAFLEIPNSDETIELSEYNASGPIDIAGKDIVHVAFEIESFEEFTKHLASIGGTYSEEPDGHIAFIDDPDGYEIELIVR